MLCDFGVLELAVPDEHSQFGAVVREEQFYLPMVETMLAHVLELDSRTLFDFIRGREH